jgi:hypothetical protein
VFYYPGDSFTKPGSDVKILAVPTCAPWLKTSEAIDFMREVNPRLFFRTHDGMLNEDGLSTIDKWYRLTSEKFGPEYRPLNPGEPIEV